MSNMHYCRFQNTLADLRECHLAMSEVSDYDQMELSDDELQALNRLISLCKRIAEENE